MDYCRALLLEIQYRGKVLQKHWTERRFNTLESVATTQFFGIESFGPAVIHKQTVLGTKDTLKNRNGSISCRLQRGGDPDLDQSDPKSVHFFFPSYLRLLIDMLTFEFCTLQMKLSSHRLLQLGSSLPP